MFCPKCGATNPDGAKFCAGCGATLGGAAASAATTGAVSQVGPVSSKHSKGRVVGIVVGVVAVVAVAAVVVYNVFFAEHAFQGDLGIASPSNPGASYGLTVSGDTMTATMTGPGGSLTVTAPITSREAQDGGTLFTCENVTWNNFSATGDASSGLESQKQSTGNLDVTAQILIPNSTSRGGVDGRWSFTARVTMDDPYSGQRRSAEFTGWAEVPEGSTQAEICVPNVNYLQQCLITGSNGSYTLSGDYVGTLTLTVLPK
ncbi:zinc ribbon domain-containing protein [Olsenella uli]|uniref:zinc ribbon domain-containing protein n=1 Tax=Olsenella uli TaxID=133926 RepID=UPI00195F22E0|nr:zinc ribbon domain-containing protein [Olsenella uli]MBM6675190.1 zinc ribbon domain-containing protein [Olsenella uli]